MKVIRLGNDPIISPLSHPEAGPNIQGPSLIRVPEWIENPLGQYYLYFADHKGAYIRLAYADDPRGPWVLHTPGSLQLADSLFPTKAPPVPPGGVEKVRAALAKAGINLDNLEHDLIKEMTAPHIASPDVHVNNINKSIVMYFHGLQGFGDQKTRVATSPDGINFTALPEILGLTYFRVFKWRGWTYSLAMPGQFYRSKDGLSNFEKGPLLFNRNMRHSAVQVRGDTLYVYWTEVGETPEHIKLSTIELDRPWQDWHESASQEILRPQLTWEGADQSLVPSVRSVAYKRVNQLRDPAIFEDGEKTYLLYAIAGESGIAIAEVKYPKIY